MKTFRSFRFTLIEVLAVIAIVAILGTIGFGTYSYANTSAREAATRSIITQLAAGMEQVKNELGYYPSTGSVWKVVKIKINDGKFYISFDGNDPSTSKVTRVGKELVKKLDIQLIEKYLDGDNQLCDAWGNPIYYCSPGKINGHFDIVAPGENGKFGTSGASSPKNDIGDYQTSGEWACDDIANFQ